MAGVKSNLGTETRALACPTGLAREGQSCGVR